MTTMIRDVILEERLLAERVVSGADRYDEVWEGVYMMAPMPNHEHQVLVGRWTRVLDEIVTDSQLGDVVPGVNISDRLEGWEKNYRVPDLAVFLQNTNAINQDSFWYGGPDFAIEIVSRNDQTREKIEFYGKVGTRELLVLDRDPWKLELYRPSDATMHLVASSELDDLPSIRSEILGFDACLRSADGRPRIHVDHSASGRSWII